MDNLADTFSRELEALATLRDELKLKAHLAKSDMRDELRELEDKLRAADETLRGSVQRAKGEASQIKGELKAALAELSSAYHRIKQQLQSE